MNKKKFGVFLICLMSAGFSFSAVSSANNAIKSSNSIIGGKRSPNVKWMVKVVSKANQYSFNCSGIALNKNVILTAAHCVEYYNQAIDNNNIRVYYNVGSESQPLFESSIVIKTEIESQADLAKLIIVPHEFNVYPKLNFNYTPIKNDEGLILGYGRNSYPPAYNQYTLVQAYVFVDSAYILEGVNYIRAYPNTGYATYGDSGGPLLINDQVVGIDKAALSGGGEIYTNLAKYSAWIESVGNSN